MKRLFLILLLPMLLQAATVELDSQWDDTTTTFILDVSDGDSVWLSADQYSPAIGMEIENREVALNLNGHTIHHDTTTCPTVYNSGFETDSSGGIAAGWDCSDCDTCLRLAGQWHYPATLWDGSYALVVGLPCSDVTVKSTESYTFRSGIRYNVSVHAYTPTDEVGTIRNSIGLLNGSDTAYMRTYPEGGYARGFCQIYAEFTAPDSGDVTYQILLRVTGADGGSIGDWRVYFDAVKIATARNHGIVIGPATAQPWKAVMSNTYTGSGSNNYHCPQCQGNGAGQKVKVTNGFVVGGAGESFGGYAFYLGEADTVILADVACTTKGDCSRNLYSHYPDHDSIDNCRFELTGESGLKRDWMLHGNIDVAGWSPYGRGVKIVNCHLHGSDHYGISCKTDASQSYTEILADTIYISSRHTNGFCVSDLGEWPVKIEDCWLNTDSTGCMGSGIQVSGKSGGKSLISGVTCKVKQIANNSQEYSSTIPAYGLQLEGAAACSVWSSSFTGTAYTDGPNAMALRLNYDTDDEIWLHSNTLKGFTETSSYVGACVQWGSMGEWNYLYNGWDIDSNTLVTNNVWLNNIAGSRGFTLRNTTFEVDTTSYSLINWRPMRGHSGHYYPKSESLLVVNADFPNDSTEELFKGSGSGFVHAWNTGTDADTCTDWFYGWETTIAAEDSNSNPVLNAPYRVVNSDGDTVYSGTVGAGGSIVKDVYEFMDLPTADEYNQATMRTDYNDYTFIAWSVDWSLSDTVTSTIDEAKTITLILGASGGSSGDRVLIRK